MVVRLRVGNPELLDDLLQFLDRRAAPRRSSEQEGEPGDNRSLRQNRCTSPGTREGRALPFMSIDRELRSSSPERVNLAAAIRERRRQECDA